MHFKALFQKILFLAAICISGQTFAEAIWIDVRSLAEHLIDNIEGDHRITHSKITDEVTKLFPDKSTKILLYCRSGNRSGKAQSALKEAGYTNVFNAGGINDARKQRGLSD